MFCDDISTIDQQKPASEMKMTEIDWTDNSFGEHAAAC